MRIRIIATGKIEDVPEQRARLMIEYGKARIAPKKAKKEEPESIPCPTETTEDAAEGDAIEP